MPPFVIEPAAPADVDRLAELINIVYATAEAGLWRASVGRTNPGEVAELIGAGELLAARLPDGSVAGCVRVHEVAERTGEFGVLAADPAHRGIGLGDALIAHAEDSCRAAGLTTMQLELLVPRDGEHPSKRFLADWYTRLGYQVVRRVTAEHRYPVLAPLLAVPCDLLTWQKPL